MNSHGRVWSPESHMTMLSKLMHIQPKLWQPVEPKESQDEVAGLVTAAAQVQILGVSYNKMRE